MNNYPDGCGPNTKNAPWNDTDYCCEICLEIVSEVDIDGLCEACAEVLIKKEKNKWKK